MTSSNSKFLIILLMNMFITFSFGLSYELPFNFERLLIRFNGVIHNNNTIICYGEGGIILRTTDFGTKWTQLRIIPDEFSIRKIISNNGNFYGIADKSYIIFSDDNGNSWNQILIKEGIDLFDIVMDEKRIFILTSLEILIYNKEFKFQNSFKIDPLLNSRNMALKADHLILTADTCKLVFIDKEKLVMTKQVNFENDTLITTKVQPNNLIVYNDDIYLTIAKVLLKSIDDGITWEKMEEKVQIFQVYNDTVYIIKTGLTIIDNLSHFFFYKLDSAGLKKINSGKREKYISYEIYNDFKFINKNFIIAVGIDKLINISTDGGLTWDIKCNLRKDIFLGFIFVDDSLGFSFTDKQIFSKTTNGGTTWIPSNFNYKVRGELEFIRPEAHFIGKNGKIILYRRAMLQNADNFLVSDDFGQNFYTHSNNDLIGYYYDIYPPQIIEKGDNYLLFECVKGYNNHIYTLIFELDTRLKLMDITILDSISLIFVKKIDDELLMSFALEKRYQNLYGTFDSSSYFLMHSSDFGKTWNKEISFNIHGNIDNITDIDGCLIFNNVVVDSFDKTKSISAINILDYKEKKFHHEVFKSDNFLSNYFKINNKIFTTSGIRKLLISNDNIRGNPSGWVIDTMKNFMYFTSYYSNDKVVYSSVTRKDSSSGFYKFVPKLVNQVEKRDDIVYLYPLKPYPIPAKNVINCIFYSSSDITNRNYNIKVYDIEGKNVPLGSDILLSNISSFKWILSWNCSGVPDGVYFILLTVGKEKITIPVIVNR